MSLSGINSFDHPLLKPSVLSDFPDETTVKKFLDMNLESILFSGIPKKIVDFLSTNFIKLSQRDNLTATTKLVFQHLGNRFKNLDENFLKSKKDESTIYHLLVAKFYHKECNLKDFETHFLKALIEKIVMLYAEMIGKASLPMVGTWKILEREFLPSFKTFLFLYHAQQNIWGMDHLLTSKDTKILNPLCYREFPFHTTILKSVLEMVEKKEDESLLKKVLDQKMSDKRCFLLDQSMSIQEKQIKIFFRFGFLADENYYKCKINEIQSPGYLKIFKRAQLPTIYAAIIFYAGPLDFMHSSKRNCESILCLIDPETEEHSLHSSDEKFINNNPSALKAWQVAQEFLTELKAEQISKLIRDYFTLDSADFVSCSVSIPQTAKEWKNYEYRLLLELGKEAKNEPETILSLAESLGVEISEKEFDQFASQEEKMELKEKKGEVNLTSETLIRVMQDQAMNSYKELKLLEEKEELKLLKETVPQKVEEDTQNIETPQFVKTANKTKKLKKELKKKEFKSSNNNNSPEQKNKMSALTSKEQKKIDAVKEGHAMPSNEFNKLALKILKKKLGAQIASIKQNQKGSHPALHFVKSDGTGSGLTLQVKHGSKDVVPKIQHQKRTIKDILEL